MISPKWAVLVAAFAVVGMISIPGTALAEEEDNGADESQNAAVEIERNNEIEQSIEQDQEACTNEAEVELDDEDVIDIAGENEAEVEQENTCDVTQTQSAANVGSIVDNSENEFDISQILLRLGLSRN